MALHTPVKAQKIAAVAAEIVEQSLVVPSLFQRVSADNFKGAFNDTINVTVPGVLPAHTLAWRTERSSSIIFDPYAERSYAITFGGNVYSAVRLQDEQADFDFLSWTKLVTPQAEAVARNIEQQCITALGAATTMVTVAGNKAARDTRASLVELRRLANLSRMPQERRTFVIGTNIEASILNLATFVLAQNVGETAALGALRDARIGRIFGMDIVVATELPPDIGYLMVPSAMVLATAGPSVPSSVPFGATASARGVGLRWLRDYDATTLGDRSVLNTYVGTRQIKDVLYNATTNAVSAGEHVIRLMKFNNTATADVVPTGAGNAINAEYTAITGIGTATP